VTTQQTKQVTCILVQSSSSEVNIHYAIPDTPQLHLIWKQRLVATFKSFHHWFKGSNHLTDHSQNLGSKQITAQERVNLEKKTVI
jgi:hypothetical protein